ncbi:hypothetical protein BgiBS90_035960, partial [Biomphalaria glabrata]
QTMFHKILVLVFLNIFLTGGDANLYYYYSTPLFCYGTSIYTWSSYMPTTNTYVACPATACYDYYARSSCCMTYLLT